MRDVSRRQFLKMSMGAAFALGLPVRYAHASLDVEARTLDFLNVHTGEKQRITYWEYGIYQPDAMAYMKRLLRDHRTNDEHEIHTALMDILWLLKEQAASVEPFHIISGYRSPQTNQMLFETTNGVRVDSFHLQGRAIDVRLPDIKLPDLKEVAIGLKFGGVGYYPKSNFIHLDTGPTEFWE